MIFYQILESFSSDGSDQTFKQWLTVFLELTRSTLKAMFFDTIASDVEVTEPSSWLLTWEPKSSIALRRSSAAFARLYCSRSNLLWVLTLRRMKLGNNFVLLNFNNFSSLFLFISRVYHLITFEYQGWQITLTILGFLLVYCIEK